jgi:hypothetical protein
MVDVTKQDETVVAEAADDRGDGSLDVESSATAAGGSDAAPADDPAKAVETADARPRRGRPRKGATAKAQGVELVLTVNGTAEATDWQAEVTHGSKRVVKALPVPASAVAAAAKDLHPDIAEAIESVLSAARDRQRSRVEQLQAELEAAQRALADLQAG